MTTSRLMDMITRLAAQGKRIIGLVMAAFLLFAAARPVSGAPLQEGFDGPFELVFFDGIPKRVTLGWKIKNLSSRPQGAFAWEPGLSSIPAQAGPKGSYMWADYRAVAASGGPGTISVWLITPLLALRDGDTYSFYTRTVNSYPPQWPDRLEVRLTTDPKCPLPSGDPFDVGSFTMLLETINPNLTLTGYPTVYTRYEGVLSSLPPNAEGCIAFRYFVTNGGPVGDNSDTIYLDTVASSAEVLDTDGDGVKDEFDNCDRLMNPDQANADGDDFGDPCDDDDDNDGIADGSDNCQFVPNPTQINGDVDERGDHCDTHLTFANTSVINLTTTGAINNDIRPANPYPSTIEVSGMPPITDLNVDFRFNSSWHRDMDVLLVGPQGQHIWLSSDAGGTVIGFPVTWTFDDEAPRFLGITPAHTNPLTDNYKPTEDELFDFAQLYTCRHDDQPPLAPPGPHGLMLSEFDGTDPNGTWQLFITTDCGSHRGQVLRWSVDFEVPDTDGDGLHDPFDPDDDADEVLDENDTCPLVSGPGAADGCPDVERFLTLEYDMTQGAFTGMLLPLGGCAAGQEVVIHRKGNDSVVGIATTDDTGLFVLTADDPNNKHYATVEEVTVPTAGRCLATVSDIAKSH